MSRLAKNLVTCAEWEHFCTATGRADQRVAKGCPRQPAVTVSWHDARVYCKWAGGRLPTEAEMEEADKGLGAADWSAWPLTELPDVGAFPETTTSNGIQDLRGVVWQWCEDEVGSNRVLRGGSWSSAAWFLRINNRREYHPSSRYSYLGFRVAFDTPIQPAVSADAGQASRCAGCEILTRELEEARAEVARLRAHADALLKKVCRMGDGHCSWQACEKCPYKGCAGHEYRSEYPREDGR